MMALLRLRDCRFQRILATPFLDTGLPCASDEGGAVGEALGAGLPFKAYNGILAHLITDQGLLIREGVIFTPRIPIEAVSLLSFT